MTPGIAYAVMNGHYKVGMAALCFAGVTDMVLTLLLHFGNTTNFFISS
jgi:hypothetical protein